MQTAGPIVTHTMCFPSLGDSRSRAALDEHPSLAWDGMLHRRTWVPGSSLVPDESWPKLFLQLVFVLPEHAPGQDKSHPGVAVGVAVESV